MNIRVLYYALGYASILVGIFAAICIFRIQNLYMGIGLSILGFILSGINIFLNQRRFYEEESYPKGYLGMVLSSLPVLFMLFVVFKFKKG
ncbi:MAG: hypothetical protein IPM51_17205 [Sphingobacteriaceae bacterium]|nr:hypothetical protein [Sphingobacteriaceae bacterium]